VRNTIHSGVIILDWWTGKRKFMLKFGSGDSLEIKTTLDKTLVKVIGHRV
jgi:hypothetical protein